MKEILAKLLNISENDIESWQLRINHNLSIETEHDFGRSYPIIEGEINQLQYEVITSLKDKYRWIDLEELLTFIYKNKK